MSKYGTRVYFPDELAKWFWERYPGQSLSYLTTTLLQEFRSYVEGKDGSLEEHLQNLHEQVNT